MIILMILIFDTFSALADEQNQHQKVQHECERRDRNKLFRTKVPQCTTKDGLRRRLGSKCKANEMASVVGLAAEYLLIYCQGAILNPHWVLSNASCYKSRILIIAGRRKLYRQGPNFFFY